MRRSLLLTLSATAMAGCVSFSTPMKNAKGEVAECQNSGWGWLGAPVAVINQKRCESNLRDRGFVPSGETPPIVQAPPAPGFSPVTPTATEAPNSVAVQNMVKASIDLPKGWSSFPITEVQSKNGVAMYAANYASEAFLSLSARSKANLADLRVFALAIQTDQSLRVSNPELSVLAPIELSGKPAYMMHVIGTPPGAPQPMRYNLLVVEGATEVAVLNVWLPERIYGVNKMIVDALITALKGLDS